MKLYQQILIALKQVATPKAKQNKFVKFEIEAQDEVLRDLLHNVTTMYSYHIKPRWSRGIKMDDPQRGIIPNTYSEWATMQNVANERLLEYVEKRIAEQKPQWQVMAEKHGWTSPSKE